MLEKLYLLLLVITAVVTYFTVTERYPAALFGAFGTLLSLLLSIASYNIEVVTSDGTIVTNSAAYLGMVLFILAMICLVYTIKHAFTELSDSL